jgi:alpha-mannosidase
MQRETHLIANKINLYISLYKDINRIDFKIDLENHSKDHRIRVLFPSNIITERVFCDGQFFVVPRNIHLPFSRHWAQKPSKTNHQKDFIALYDNSKCIAILNRGLPEYEAIRNEDNTVSIAITLLRCIEWLSRPKLDSRRIDAGPSIKTPGAQCIGNHTFEFSLVVEDCKTNWLDSEIHIKGKEFNCPLKPLFPLMLKSPLRKIDLLILSRMGVLSALNKLPEKKIDSYLPNELSFLELDNKNVVLTALKKSEKGDFLITRVYNISPSKQNAYFNFYKKITIKNAEIVNLLEETPKNTIKAKINSFNKNKIEISLEPHVIATIKIEFEFNI